MYWLESPGKVLHFPPIGCISTYHSQVAQNKSEEAQLSYEKARQLGYTSNQMSILYENGSHTTGVASKDDSDVETCTLDFSARDSSLVASSGLAPLLEVEDKDKGNTSESVS